MKDVVVVDAVSAETGSLQEVASYTIQADAKMFRILINGLYSDKPRAIVRELCANARDSHAQAGILDRPFKLQLPTRWDETFAVRDYGVSLTHDQVMHLYTTVGASTKGDDNIAVGKFGLGSKTPFAYTDSFAIMAILDGEKRLYNAFMDAGTPKIALLVTEPTDEEQGVEISFAVQHKDHDAFKQAARRTLLGFDVMPENNADLAQVQFNVLYEGTDWKIVSRDHINGMQGPMVRQGCIFYPIDREALRAVRPSEALDALSDEVLILDMPIGSVDITPSRESLSYDATTAKNILDRCEAVFTTVMDTFTHDVAGQPTFYGAIRAREKVLGSISNYRLRDRIGDRLRWRGRRVPDKLKVDHKRTDVLRKYHGVNLTIINHPYNRRRTGGTVELMGAGSLVFAPDEVLTFVYNPSAVSPKHLKARLLAADRLPGRVYYLDNFCPGTRAETFLRVALGRPDIPMNFVDLNTIEFVKPDYQRKKAKINIMSARGDFEEVLEDDLYDRYGSIYYVRSYNGDVSQPGISTSNEYTNTAFQTLKAIEFIEKDAVLVVIPASRKDYATKVPEDWTAFFDYAQRKVALNFDGKKADKASVLDMFNSRHSCWAGEIAALTSVGPIDNPDSVFGQTVTLIADYMTAQTLGESDRRLVNIIPRIFEQAEIDELIPDRGKAYDTSVLTQAKERFFAAYPLVTHCNSYMEADEAAQWVEYITLKDRADGEKRAYDALT